MAKAKTSTKSKSKTAARSGRLKSLTKKHYIILAIVIVLFGAIGLATQLFSRAYSCSRYTTTINGHTITTHPQVSYGSSGGCVSYLQDTLNHVPNNLIYPKLTVDGSFGPKTKSAVLEFQGTSYKDFEGRTLADDGIVGPRTWYALEKATGRYVAPSSTTSTITKKYVRLWTSSLSSLPVYLDACKVGGPTGGQYPQVNFRLGNTSSSTVGQSAVFSIVQLSNPSVIYGVLDSDGIAPGTTVRALYDVWIENGDFDYGLNISTLGTYNIQISSTNLYECP